MNNIDLGPIRLNPRGEYDDAAEYRYLDLVSYNGSSYICKNYDTIDGIACIGVPPVGAEQSDKYFMLSAERGDTGPIAESYQEFTTLTEDGYWDYSKCDKVIIKDPSILEVAITNVYSGCCGVILSPNELSLPLNSDYSIDFWYAEVNGPSQYFMYSFICVPKSDGSLRLVWNRSVIQGEL